MINVSMAGIDETIGIRQLELLSEGFPKLELALLFSYNNSGNQLRYPSLNYIREVLDRVSHNKLAIHLCGSVIDDFCEQGEDFVYKDLFSQFERIQFNTKVTTRLSPYISKITTLYPVTIFIQPVSSFAETALDPTFNLLLDNSGGQGKQISSIPAPLPNFRCGYAGGITPLNIIEIKRQLEKFKTDNIWIDLESGIRNKLNKIEWSKMHDICSILSN